MSSTDPTGVSAVALHHVAVVTKDMRRAKAFYLDVLGLDVHPTRPNWLMIGGHAAVHLLELPNTPGKQTSSGELAHLAIQVASLEAARDRLLAANLRPYQLKLKPSIERRDVDADTDLNWSIGTLFVLDPDGNNVELVQAGRGVFFEPLRDRGRQAPQGTSRKRSTR